MTLVGSSVVPGGCPAEAVGGGVVVAQPVGLAVEGEHHAAVQQPIEQCGRDGGITQDFSPRPTGLLVVNTMEDFKYRCETT
jgi:hypothetical protein